ncbi:1259_t:CDS:2, partial [Racocetra fulgida]
CQDLTESDDSLMNPAIEEAQNVENFECSSNINQDENSFQFQHNYGRVVSHNVNTQKQNLSNYIDSPFEAENQYYQYSNNVDDKLHNNLFANNARYQSGLIDLNSTNKNGSNYLPNQYNYSQVVNYNTSFDSNPSDLQFKLYLFQLIHSPFSSPTSPPTPFPNISPTTYSITSSINKSDSPLSKNFKEVKRQLSVPRNKSSPLSKNFKEVKRQLSALNENYPPLSQNFNEDKRQLSVTYMTNESFSDYHDSDGITISNNQRLISIHDTTQMVNDSNMNLEFDPKYHFRDAIEGHKYFKVDQNVNISYESDLAECIPGLYRLLDLCKDDGSNGLGT